MNKNKINLKNVYILFNKGVTKLIGLKTKLKFKKILILILNL